MATAFPLAQTLGDSGAGGGSSSGSGASVNIPSAGEVSPQQVGQWLKSGQAVLVDVREMDEHAREHIEGARLVPLSQFDLGLVESMVPAKGRLVLHCKGGKRSADAARLAASLAGRGVTVLSMTGGIENWKKQGLAVTVNRRVSGVSVMRQVQLVIGFFVLGGCALAYLVHPWFVGVPAFFGAGLLFAGATGTCGLATVLGKMPWNRARSCGPGCGG